MLSSDWVVTTDHQPFSVEKKSHVSGHFEIEGESFKLKGAELSFDADVYLKEPELKRVRESLRMLWNEKKRNCLS
ncbi:hypothetical protein GCM10011389_16900 [Pontibacillus salipaludis]|uniref:Uncharacterized protein n=1 Tax=Pontibacillus salipaludis TaxID=1697394 RepID=A0ABQ1Q1E7_9BACI|nr:hypothetical protein GCM10011389_16900 [Pontibacillus salipaludis]